MDTHPDFRSRESDGGEVGATQHPTGQAQGEGANPNLINHPFTTSDLMIP
jgi:hypothetical protein